jgi:hypothetical protein
MMKPIERSDCCNARILEPVGAPFDMGKRVCADCGAVVEDA